MLIFGFCDFGLFTEVYAHSAVKDDFIVEGFADELCAVNVEKGDYDSAEGF